MAMIKCPECGKEMSDKAAACPNCGCPIEEIRTKIEEIEAEREAKIKAKEEEKKAKEVAAEIKKQKKDEARKAVTPEMKRKRIIICVVTAIAVIAGGICAWYYGIKIPKEKAYNEYLVEVDAYNEGLQNYNAAIDAYNDKVKEIISKNDELTAAIDAAQALVDCGETPYEGDKITTLSNSIKDARNNKAETPELKDKIAERATPIPLKSSKADIEENTTKLISDLSEINNRIVSVNFDKDDLVIPDYSSYYDTLEIQSKALQDSYDIQKQITAPEEDWVMTRLGRVSDVANMAPVTEENDPNGNLNKVGGYTSTVYFGTPLLGTEEKTGDAVIEAGNQGGGAIETYRTVEDAEARNTYLSAFDGGGFISAGSHKVLGTMVIRTSDKLKASQQETLTNAIINEMISLD